MRVNICTATYAHKDENLLSKAVCQTKNAFWLAAVTYLRFKFRSVFFGHSSNW